MADGISLVEVLIMCGIVLVLAAIVLPIISRSKDRALAADDLGRLRQLGQAGAMYQELQGTLPFACAQLVQSGYVPAKLCQGTTDHTPKGIGAACDRMSPVDDAYPDPGFRVTFVGLANVRVWPGAASWKTWAEGSYNQLRDSPGFGWLVDNLRQSKANGFAGWSHPEDCFFGGPYRRLLADSAVVVRQKRWYDVKGKLLYDRRTWFADIELAELEQ